MEKNRPATIFSVIVIVLICGVGIWASFASTPDHPIKSSLITLAIILGGLVAITAIFFLVFVPLFTLIARIVGKSRNKAENGQRSGDGSDSMD